MGLNQGDSFKSVAKVYSSFYDARLGMLLALLVMVKAAHKEIKNMVSQCICGLQQSERRWIVTTIAITCLCILKWYVLGVK